MKQIAQRFFAIINHLDKSLNLNCDDYSQKNIESILTNLESRYMLKQKANLYKSIKSVTFVDSQMNSIKDGTYSTNLTKSDLVYDKTDDAYTYYVLQQLEAPVPEFVFHALTLDYFEYITGVSQSRLLRSSSTALAQSKATKKPKEKQVQHSTISDINDNIFYNLMQQMKRTYKTPGILSTILNQKLSNKIIIQTAQHFVREFLNDEHDILQIYKWVMLAQAVIGPYQEGLKCYTFKEVNSDKAIQQQITSYFKQKQTELIGIYDEYIGRCEQKADLTIHKGILEQLIYNMYKAITQQQYKSDDHFYTAIQDVQEQIESSSKISQSAQLKIFIFKLLNDHNMFSTINDNVLALIKQINFTKQELIDNAKEFDILINDYADSQGYVSNVTPKDLSTTKTFTQTNIDLQLKKEVNYLNLFLQDQQGFSGFLKLLMVVYQKLQLNFCKKIESMISMTILEQYKQFLNFNQISTVNTVQQNISALIQLLKQTLCDVKCQFNIFIPEINKYLTEYLQDDRQCVEHCTHIMPQFACLRSQLADDYSETVKINVKNLIFPGGFNSIYSYKGNDSNLQVTAQSIYCAIITKLLQDIITEIVGYQLSCLNDRIRFDEFQVIISLLNDICTEIYHGTKKLYARQQFSVDFQELFSKFMNIDYAIQIVQPLIQTQLAVEFNFLANLIPNMGKTEQIIDTTDTRALQASTICDDLSFFPRNIIKEIIGKVYLGLNSVQKFMSGLLELVTRFYSCYQLQTLPQIQLQAVLRGETTQSQVYPEDLEDPLQTNLGSISNPCLAKVIYYYSSHGDDDAIQELIESSKVQIVTPERQVMNFQSLQQNSYGNKNKKFQFLYQIVSRLNAFEHLRRNFLQLYVQLSDVGLQFDETSKNIIPIYRNSKNLGSGIQRTPKEAELVENYFKQIFSTITSMQGNYVQAVGQYIARVCMDQSNQLLYCGGTSLQYFEQLYIQNLQIFIKFVIADLNPKYYISLKDEISYQILLIYRFILLDSAKRSRIIKQTDKQLLEKHLLAIQAGLSNNLFSIEESVAFQDKGHKNVSEAVYNIMKLQFDKNKLQQLQRRINRLIDYVGQDSKQLIAIISQLEIQTIHAFNKDKTQNKVEPHEEQLRILAQRRYSDELVRKFLHKLKRQVNKCDQE